MNNDINIVYIDDKIDLILSEYLANFKLEDISIEYSEEPFSSKSDDYKMLFNNEAINMADIVVIDSKLFENSSVEKKFSGEEFKLIYTKIHPYSKVIVISQNNNLERYGTIKKFSYNSDDKKTSKDYYDHCLRDNIKSLICEIIKTREIIKIFDANKASYEDDVIMEKIKNSVEKVPSYDLLTDKKIDELILMVKSLLEDVKKSEKNGL